VIVNLEEKQAHFFIKYLTLFSQLAKSSLKDLVQQVYAYI